MKKLDSIRLSDLKIFGHHGVTEAERNKGQIFQIEIELFLDTSKSQKSDVLADTYDYEPLYDKVKSIVEDKSYALLERLADEIMFEIFRDKRVEEASVSLAKPGILGGGTPIVTVRRMKEGSP